MVWSGMVCYGMVWYGHGHGHGMVSEGGYLASMVWYGRVGYGMVWYMLSGMVWYGMVCMVSLGESFGLTFEASGGHLGSILRP